STPPLPQCSSTTGSPGGPFDSSGSHTGSRAPRSQQDSPAPMIDGIGTRVSVSHVTGGLLTSRCRIVPHVPDIGWAAGTFGCCTPGWYRGCPISGDGSRRATLISAPAPPRTSFPASPPV